MRKLVFMLKGKTSGQTPNLDISTHYGARLSVSVNQATVLDVTNDALSDGELLNWYKSRYSGYGMGISILHDSETAATPVISEESIPVKEVKVTDSAVQDASDKIVDSSEQVKVDEKESSDVVESGSNISVVESIPAVEDSVEDSAGSVVSPKESDISSDLSDLQTVLWS